MTRTVIVGPPWLHAAVAARARELADVTIAEPSWVYPVGGADVDACLQQRGIEAVVYFAADATCEPDADAATPVWAACRRAGVRSVVLVSSAAAYGASAENPGLMQEARAVPCGPGPDIKNAWRRLERAARRHFQDSATVLTILRPAATAAPAAADCFSRLLRSRIAVTLPGHDPTIQVLHVADLADAVCRALERGVPGVFNVAPDEPITLRAAIRLRGGLRVPVPCALQRGWNLLAASTRGDARSDDLDYLRYSWTVSNAKARRLLTFAPSRTSADALAESGASPDARLASRHFDPFGLDERYIARFSRTLLRFLQRWYWRMEVAGLEHVPRTGRAVIVGMHRGFMPWDGVMTLHVIARETGRIPRFLIHPGVGLRFPFLSNFMTKLGGVIACRENAAYVLDRDEILGVYPEGIRGAFTPYRRAYSIAASWRDEFVTIALRHRAPIVPFVTVGSAEIFPILGRIDWPWWKRQTGWPCFPLTPTFPLVPLPLPSKWHTQFLAPIHVERLYPADAADDPATVRQISDTVKQRIAEAAQSMVRRRRSVFFGSVFDSRSTLEERTT
jgi:1-acyl-sn-glycerol-3-phosphate acyltransferase/nucleoside-diphosphate-sugar epimerase